MSMNATNAKIERPAGEAVEAVGDVDAVGRRDDREGREQRCTADRVDRHGADERHADRRDVVGLLDLARGDDGHDGQPEELLADA